MAFSWFKKKDPICGMKEEKGKGFLDGKTGNWFCSESCRQEYYSKVKEQERKVQNRGGSCCH